MIAASKSIVVVFLCAFAIAGCAQQSAGTGSAAQSAAPAAVKPASNISYSDRVTLAVGESVVVHGLRGECGALPTSARVAQATADLNAQTNLGKFSFGDEGVRKSGSCGGETPALQTIFTATTPGQQTVRIHGDPVTITVL